MVRIEGRDHYLGPYGSPESHDRYERRIAEWRAKQTQAALDRQTAAANGRFELTVAQVVYRYREFPGTTLIKLEQNYRSTQPILAATNQVIAQAAERFTTDLWTPCT